MARKNYWIYSNKYISHNYAILKSKEDGLKVSSITAIGNDGLEIEILSNPISIGKTVSIRYPVLTSDRVRITIDHPLSEVLRLEDLLSVQLGLDNYRTIGSYISQQEQINFNKNLTVVYDIDNILDAFVKTEIHLSIIDSYDNIIYSSIIPISINDDGWMVEHTTSGTNIELPYEPIEDSLYILIEGSKVDSFEIDGKFIAFSIPEGYDCFIIYKPKFIEEGGFYEFSNDIKLTPSYDIILREDYANKINFSIAIDVYNPDVTSTNHTPIIKSLGIMTSDK
ncbi:MAG: hypothetical protein DRQ78_00750 [Epsilonproteobacteria bacterium]|nr:MAG: hypothetical protein DRQ78_00750 [Campylobacterota bacterium]